MKLIVTKLEDDTGFRNTYIIPTTLLESGLREERQTELAHNTMKEKFYPA